MPLLLVLLQAPLQLDNAKKILDGFYAYYPLNLKYKYQITSIVNERWFLLSLTYDISTPLIMISCMSQLVGSGCRN